MKQVKSRYCKEARYMSFSCKISGSSQSTYTIDMTIESNNGQMSVTNIATTER